MVEKETYRIIENLTATFILYSPNFLLLFDTMKLAYPVFMLYNWGVLFLVVSKLSFSRNPEVKNDV